MTTDEGADVRSRDLRLGIVLGSREEECTVVVGGRSLSLPYASPFPRPRVQRVDPGHLVAFTAASGEPGAVVWRWFDAVVVEAGGSTVALWEPHHGAVSARPRDPGRAYLPGSRAYVSAGLPGAEWWVSGAAVHRAEEADVDLDQVAAFYTEHDLWSRFA